MKNKEGNLKRLIPYYKKYWKLLILTIILSFSYAGLSILSPVLEGNLLTAFTTLVNPKATDEEVIEVCKKAQIHDFIISKENGYDSFIGENGITLSGGQKQRLAIARALIKKSKIILLDEATSSLDNESQEKIKLIMKELSKNHTVIIVAHRLSTIIDADKIMVFSNHKIIEEGTHQELMQNSLIYKKLYETENTAEEYIMR